MKILNLRFYYESKYIIMSRYKVKDTYLHTSQKLLTCMQVLGCEIHLSIVFVGVRSSV